MKVQLSTLKYRKTAYAWAIVATWCLVCLTTLSYNGPFMDEGIYVTAGLRTLEGHGITDGFLGWFAGSLLWPVLAGLGDRAAGVVGARAFAVAMVTLAYVALVQATQNLFDSEVTFWTSLAFALSAPVMALARLAVYDASALAGVATSFWAITQLNRTANRSWLVLAAVAFCWALFCKYPIGLMLLPLMGVLLALRGGKAMLDVSIFGFVSLSITLAFFLPVREQVVSFFGYRLVNSPAIGVTLPMYAVDLVRLSAVPMLLALVGWWVARRRRGLATVLLLAMLMWPAYHLVLRDSVSRSKHLVFGFLFGYPLVGLALDWGWECAGRQFGAHPRLGKALGRGSVAVLVLGLAALGAVQLGRFNQAWPDARPAAEYLLAHVRPGHKLLINESWPYTTYLYAAGRIDSPWDVFDVYRITHGQSEIDLCDYDWFVDSQGAYQWPGPIVFRIHRCGGFERVFVSESTVVGMGPELDYVRYPVKVAVWRNVASALETEGGAK